MKRFIQNVIVVIVAVFFYTDLFAQKDLVISGGNSVSSYVCANRKVYTWGNNKTTAGTGLLGTGGTADDYSTPQPVPFPVGVDITQVNSGSGSHFVALDCNFNAWSWGNNSLGQVGNGVAAGDGGFVNAPTRVLAGAGIAGTHKNGSNQLTNVDVVYAGNNSSFAILNNGDLVSWGANGKGFSGAGYDDAYGQLGNGVLPAVGTTVTQNSAGYVKKFGGATLTDVTQVFAGDNFAMALVDTDGDGVGTVYTWGDGKNGCLARDANGTTNPNNATEIFDPWAREARYGNGLVMDNIVQIYCGDVFGAALDVNGYVWTWGNGGWNNCTGTGQAGSTPNRVLKGTTTGGSNDGTYLLAKMIGAGQGYGMAVTADNKPVAWGGGGAADGGGFSGGSSAGAEYITYAPGAVHNNVILINRGDTWGFYGTSDGKMWAWGANAIGQLGIGTKTAEVIQATQINPPALCDFKDPLPTVDLTPGSTTVCATGFAGLTLNAGFLIDPTLAANYRIDWYKNGALVSTGTAAAALTYNATTVGVYKVVNTYTGTNYGCIAYDPAEQTMTIAAYPQPFDIPAITFCGDNVNVNVTPKTPALKPTYNWYATAGSAVVLGTTEGSAATSISIAGVPLVGSTKTVYVQEMNYANGNFIKKTEGCSGGTGWNANPNDFNTISAMPGTFMDVSSNNINATGFTVNSQVTMTEAKFTGQVECYGLGLYDINVTVSIYGAKTAGGGLVVDNANKIGDFTPVLYSYNRAGWGDANMGPIQEMTVTGNIVLPPGNYFMAISKIAGPTTNGKFKVGNCNTALSTALVDDADGTLLKFVGVSQNNNPNQSRSGNVYDMKFKTGQKFCDRVPVVLTQLCLCDDPNPIALTGLDPDNTMCPGDAALNLSMNNQPSTTLFDFTWYKGSIAPGNIIAGPIVGNKLPQTVAYADLTGAVGTQTTYIVRARDASDPTNSACWKDATVTIRKAALPTYTIDGGGTFCDNVTPTAVTTTITGVGPFDYTFNPGAVVRTNIATATSTLGSAAGTYTLTAVKDLYCTGVPTAASQTITINKVPTSTINANKTAYCGATSDVNLSLTPGTGVNLTGATYQWKKNGVNDATTATITGATAGSWTCVITLLTCTYTTPAVVITQSDNPVYTITGTGSYCPASGTKTPVVVTFTAGTGPFNFTMNGTAYTNQTSPFSLANPTGSAGGTTYTLTAISDSKGCTATSGPNVVVTNLAAPTLTVGALSGLCSGTATTVNVAPVVTASAPVTYAVTSPATASITAAGVLTLSGTGVHNITVTATGTVAPFCVTTATTSVEVWANPTVSFPVASGCASTNIQLTATAAGGSGTYSSYAWTGATVASLTNAAIFNPNYNNATANTYPLTVEVTDNRNCKGTGTNNVTVHPIPVATLAAADQEFCVDVTTPELITATITPAVAGTGSWTAPAAEVTETTANFTPSTAGVGGSPYSITYNFLSSNNCASVPVSIVMTVNPLPNPTITPSKVDVCISGNNSDPVTFTTTGTVPTGTFTYSGATGINATTGEFDPKLQTAGTTKTISLLYADLKGCTKTVTNTVNIKALPTITFGANPTTMCVYDAPHTVLVTPTATAPATGTFSGAITTSSFNPATATIGANAITYTYRDNFGCENAANTNITVAQTAPPTVDAPNPKTIVITVLDQFPGSEVPTLSATPDAGHTIEWLGGTTCLPAEVPIATTNTYNTGKLPTQLGSWTYKVRQKNTATGCVSPCEDAILVHSKCPAKTPTADDSYYCVGEAGPLTLTATPQSVHAAGDKLEWFSDAAKTTSLIDGNTFTSALTTAAATTQTVYVAEWNQASACYSSAKAVTLHIVENPTVTLTIPSPVCAVAGTVNITAVPGGGTLTNTGAADIGFNAAAKTWDPMASGAPSPSKTLGLQYVVTETQPDGKVCSTTKTASSTAHFMETPDPEPKTWLITDMGQIPLNHMTASTKGTGDAIKWYTTATKSILLTNPPFSATTLVTDRANLIAEVGTPVPDSYTKSYWITQVDINGCESQPVQVDLLLVNCPFLKPDVISEEECQGATLGNLSASTPETVKTWKWYDKNNVDLSNNATAYSLATFDNATAGVTNFYVSYIANEPISGKDCESPKSTVTVTINANPVISAINSKALYCNTESDAQLSPTVVYAAGATKQSDAWSLQAEVGGISATGLFSPSFKGETTGSYVISYTATDSKGCTSTFTKPVDVQYTAPPANKTEYIELMTSTPQVYNIEALGLTTAVLPDVNVVKWYNLDKSNPSATLSFTGNPYPVHTVFPSNVAVNQTRHATQTIRGCESKSIPVAIVITDCPVPAPLVTHRIICNYADNPELQAAIDPIWLAPGVRPVGLPSEFRYYATQTGPGAPLDANTAGTFTPNASQLDKTIAGVTTYYVSEYNPNVSPAPCESPRSPITITVNKTPKPTIPPVTNVCFGETNPTFTATNLQTGASVEWYETVPVVATTTTPADAILVGGTYLPSYTVAAVDNMVYAVQRVNDCMSEPESQKFTIYPTPAAPALIGNETCFGLPNTPLQATGSTIIWYNSSNAKIAIDQNSFTPGTSVSVANTYNYFATQTVNGCESPKGSVVYTIKPKPAAPTLVSSLPQICEYDNDPVFTATAQPSATVKWYTKDNVYLALQDGLTFNPVKDGSPTILYKATQTVDGCESNKSEVFYFVNPKPETPVVQNRLMCEGTSIPTLSSSSSTDRWFSSTTSTIPMHIGSSYTPTVAELSGKDTVTYYVNNERNGCVSDTEPVSLIHIKKPVFSIGAPISTCIYQTNIVIQAKSFVPAITPTSNIDWAITKSNGYNKPLENSITNSVTITQELTPISGEYEIKARYGYDYGNTTCYSDTISIDYKVNDRPRKPTVVPRIVCQDEDIQPLFAFGSPYMTWTSLNGLPPTTGSLYDFKALGVGDIAVGVYNFELRDVSIETSCESDPTPLRFEVADAAKPKIVGDTMLCVNEAEVMYAMETVPSVASSYTWEVSGGHVNYSKDHKYSPLRYVDFLRIGIDTIIVSERTWAGCEESDTLIVRIAPYPVPKFLYSIPGADASVELVDSTIQESIIDTLSNGDIFKEDLTYTMSWNFGQTIDGSHIDTLVQFPDRHKPIIATGYRYGYYSPMLTVENNYGCVAKYTKELFIDIARNMFIPNAFAPGNPALGVGHWKPIAFNLESAEVFVFDVWGNVVWYSNDVRDGMFAAAWDGKVNGVLLKSDTYIWKINAKFIDGFDWPGKKQINGVYVKYGSVLLLR